MKNLKFILDPKLGGKIRLVLVTAIGIATYLTGILENVRAAGGVISIPILLSILTHGTKIGNSDGNG